MRAASGLCSPLICEARAWVGGMHAGCGLLGQGDSCRGLTCPCGARSYSIVIEGERGNRQRIYSLEQLLQEAVRKAPA